MFEYDIKIQDS